MGWNLARYAVTVVPIRADDGQWWPYVQITDDEGRLVKDTNTAAVRFSTKAEAERVGWDFAEEWIRSRSQAA
jgi:hypothetical protein